MIILYGTFTISFVYLVAQLYLGFTKAVQRSKSYKTDWFVYNTTAEFRVNHISVWFYSLVLLISLYFIGVNS